MNINTHGDWLVRDAQAGTYKWPAHTGMPTSPQPCWLSSSCVADAVGVGILACQQFTRMGIGLGLVFGRFNLGLVPSHVGGKE